MSAVKKTEIPQDTAGKTETFWTRNVRLITFLICALLILSVIGPVSILYIDDYLRAMEQDGRKSMTVEDVIAIADSPRTLKMRALDQFKGEKSENGENENRTVTYTIDVGKRYFLMAGFYTETGTVYYLNLTDLETNTNCDLLDRKSDITEFLK